MVLFLCQTAVLAGGWRLDVVEAFSEMAETYGRFKTTNINAPSLKIYVLGSNEFSEISEYALANLGAKQINSSVVV